MDEPDDLVVRAADDREARVWCRRGLLDRPRNAPTCVDELDLCARHHHLSQLPLTCFEYLVDERALVTRQRAWEEAHRRVYPSLSVEAGFPFAGALLESGQVGAAQEVIRETLDLVDRIGLRGRLLGRSQFVAQEVAFHSGDRRTTVAELMRKGETLDRHSAMAACQVLATWLALLDGPAAATEVVAQVEAGRRCAADSGCPRCGLELELWGAKALASVGRWAEASHTIRAWDAARPDPNPADAVTRQWVEGLVTAQESASAPAAAGRLSAALTAAERTGRVIDAIGIQLDLAKVLSGSDREAAVEQLAAATAEARAAGSVALGRVADRGLRELGIRTWRRGRPPGHRRREQPRDRGTALPLAQDRGAPRVERTRESRRPESHRARSPTDGDRRLQLSRSRLGMREFTDDSGGQRSITSGLDEPFGSHPRRRKETFR